jgi:hypothetical protein
MASFKESLTASFRQIRADRAEGIAEDTELEYKRTIEDLCRQIRGYDRSRENLIIDLAPGNITSTNVVPADFKASVFKEKDLELGLLRRDAVIKLEIAIDRYEDLFGKYPDERSVKAVLPNWNSKIVTE